MWYKNVCIIFFRIVTVHAIYRQMEGQTDRKGLEMPCVALHAVARYNKLHRNFRNKVVYDYDKNRKICCMIKS